MLAAYRHGLRDLVRALHGELGGERDLAAPMDRQCGDLGGHCNRVAGRGRALRSIDGSTRRRRPPGLELPFCAGGYCHCHGGGNVQRTPIVRFSALNGKLSLGIAHNAA